MLRTTEGEAVEAVDMSVNPSRVEASRNDRYGLRRALAQYAQSIGLCSRLANRAMCDYEGANLC